MPMQHYRAETFQLRSSVGCLVKRAQALLLERVESAVAGSGFTFTQWLVLMYLRDGLAVNAADLCAQIRHDSGALTRMIDQLEARGLVQRERSREDRRAVQLRLTDTGLKTIESLIPQVVEQLNWSLSGFSQAEFAELTRLLTKLVAHIGSADGRAGDAG
jgi:DNA-binding MarR family transcriptional regulator